MEKKPMKVCRALLVLVFLQEAVGVGRGDNLDKQLQQWVDKSTLIFTGKLVALRSNVDSIDKKDGPMLVSVESVQSGNEEALEKFGSLAGMELTVILDPSSKVQPPKEGISVVFFVNPLMYERNIAVIAHAIEDEKTVPGFSKRIEKAVQRKDEKPLKDAVASAARIVIGTVEKIRALPEAKLAQLRPFANGSDFFSEHSPRWKEALISVHSVLKGEPGEKMVLVVFPSTDDRMWSDSPKPTPPQDGIWLLHVNEVTKEEVSILLAPEKVDGRETKVYTTINPEDFLPNDPDKKNEARIREILKSL